MSENEFNRRTHQRMQEELAELNDPRNRQQRILDDWWQTQRDLAAEERRLMRDLNPTGLKIW
jgi:hypothetical protein